MQLVEVVAADDGDQEAQQLFVALEFPARFGAKAMKHLSTHFQSLAELGFAHLKRLKKHPKMENTLVALVCPKKNNKSISEFRELETLFEATLTTSEALKRPPRTRELYEKHTQLWPLIFHASVQKLATSSPIEENEKQNMENHLRVALQIGCFLKKERQESLRCAWGCVVVDPEADELVATSIPTKNMQLRYAFEMLYHPVMVAINEVAERDRQKVDELKAKMAHKKQKRREKEDTAGRKLIETTNKTKPSDSYLCTGYDVYLDREPCAMCAMALVHSRARHVVFDRANPSDGVLLSSFKLHTIKSINHHYRVFQLPLSEGVE